MDGCRSSSLWVLQDHAQIFALLAAKFEGEARPTDVPSSWPELAAEGAADMLRCGHLPAAGIPKCDAKVVWRLSCRDIAELYNHTMCLHVERRMLFAGATVQALAAAAGPDASAAAAAWQGACAPLWTAVADTAHVAAQQPPSGNLGAAVMPAVEAADGWAAETGGLAAFSNRERRGARPCVFVKRDDSAATALDM